MLLELNNAKITLKDFVDRKTEKEYNQALYRNVDIDMDNAKKASIPLSNLEEANDCLVLNMVLSIESEPPIQNTKQNFAAFLEGLPREQYKELLSKCLEKYNSSDYKKK
jgi:hypothetical protein